MDIASVFEWFAQETVHIAEQANEVRRRETLGKLALLWAAAAAEQRNKQQATSNEQDEPRRHCLETFSLRVTDQDVRRIGSSSRTRQRQR